MIDKILTVWYDVLNNNREVMKLIKSVRGLLSQYANPKLQKEEESAWAKAVEEKYGGNAINVLLDNLDEAIDDMEHGKVQTIEEAWAEIDDT